MKLRNTTDFDTAALRSWLRRVVREVEVVLAKNHPALGSRGAWTHDRAEWILARCDVWIRQARADRRLGLGLEAGEQAWSTGRASYSGSKLRMTIGGPDLALAVWLMRHEVWHLFGVHHRDFPAAIMREDGGALAAVREVYGIAPGATLPLATAPTKAAPTAEQREAAALADIAEKRKRWTTKLRRAQTALAKLRTRERYYERVAAKRGGRTP